MNTRIRNLVLVAVAAAFPLTAMAQSTQSSSNRTPSASSSSTSSSHSTSDRATALGSVRHVSEDSIEMQFTSKDLIGKEVYDNRGKKVGEVKDIVLGSSTNAQLASALSTTTSGTSMHNDSSAVQSGSSRNATTNTTAGSTADLGQSRTAGASNVGAGSVDRSTSGMSGNQLPQSHSAMGELSSEPAAVVSFGGFMSKNLLQIPISQLNYDSSNQRITINLSDSDLSSLKASSETSRRAAE